MYDLRSAVLADLWAFPGVRPFFEGATETTVGAEAWAEDEGSADIFDKECTVNTERCIWMHDSQYLFTGSLLKNGSDAEIDETPNLLRANNPVERYHIRSLLLVSLFPFLLFPFPSPHTRLLFLSPSSRPALLCKDPVFCILERAHLRLVRPSPPLNKHQSHPYSRTGFNFSW